MVAIEPILEDIRRRFKTDDVRLPTAVEVRTLTASFWGSELETLNDVEEETPDDHQVNLLGESSNSPWETASSSPILRHPLGIPSTTDRYLPNELVQGPVAENTHRTVEQKNKSLDEKPFLHDMLKTSLHEPSAPPRELPRDSNESRVPATDQAAPNPSIIDHGISTLPNSTQSFRHAISKRERKVALESCNVSVHYSSAEQWQTVTTSEKKSKSLSAYGIIGLPYRFWRFFETLILRIEHRRRQDWHRVRGLRKSPPFRLFWILNYPRYPGDTSSILHVVLKAVKVFWYYVTIPFIPTVNILANIFYVLLCFPMIFWVSHRHRVELGNDGFFTIATFRAYLICAFAAFGGILFGYDTGWMSGVLAMPYFIRQYTGLPYPDPDDDAAVKAFHLPASDQSLTTSILSCVTFFGAIIASDVADFIGRRTTIISGCGIFIVGCILQIASTSLGLMVPGRLICGFGVGFVSATVILYMSVSRFASQTLAGIWR